MRRADEWRPDAAGAGRAGHGGRSGWRIHVAKVDPSGAVTTDRLVEFNPATDDEFDATQLPTGDWMLFQTLEGTVHHLWQAGMAPGAVPRDLGIQTSSGFGKALSPDGRQILLFFDDGTSPTVVENLDLATNKITQMSAGGDLNWQRTAE
jgi:hypothetical protein